MGPIGPIPERRATRKNSAKTFDLPLVIPPGTHIASGLRKQRTALAPQATAPNSGEPGRSGFSTETMNGRTGPFASTSRRYGRY